MITCSLEAKVAIFCFFFILFLFVQFIAIITGSHLVGIFLILFALYKILRYVGIFALYPGCFGYIKADIELRGSKRLADSIMQVFQDYYGFLHSAHSHPKDYLYRTYLAKHSTDILDLLTKFEGTLSPQKQNLLHYYQNLCDYLETEEQFVKKDGEQVIIKLSQFLWEPEEFKRKLGADNQNIIKDLAHSMRLRCMEYTNAIQGVLKKLEPPVDGGPIKAMFYRIYSEKLFEIRFSYTSWEPKFNYEVKVIDSADRKEKIECALIRSSKKINKISEQSPNMTENKAIMFCLPNGAYLQYFAIESQYIDMYLELGYQIILWNYRGYGQSTGDPELHISMQDAQTVYEFYSNQQNLNIEIVHGYSIGGPAAINVAMKNSPTVKMIITDRTFSNIATIAENLSPYLRKLCKLVMRTDSQIHLCEMFVKSRNKCKVLIWADNDEIIADPCSLKMGMMKFLFQNSMIKIDSNYDKVRFEEMSEEFLYVCSNENDSMDQSHRLALTDRETDVETEDHNHNKNHSHKLDAFQHFKRTVEEFSMYLLKLYMKKIEIETGKVHQKKEAYSYGDTFSLHEQVRDETEESEKVEMIKFAVTTFWKTFESVDGGGMKGSEVMKYIDKCISKSSKSKESLKNTLNSLVEEDDNEEIFEEQEQMSSGNPVPLEHVYHLIFRKVQSFLMGLLVFGSCYRNMEQGSFQNHQDFVMQERQKSEQEEEMRKSRKFGDNLQYTLEQLDKILNEHIPGLKESRNRLFGCEEISHIYEIMRMLKFYKQTIQKNMHSSNTSTVVIPTQAGHNGELSTHELRYLKQIIISCS